MAQAFPVLVPGDCEEDSADAGAGLVIGELIVCGLYILRLDWMRHRDDMGRDIDSIEGFV